MTLIERLAAGERWPGDNADVLRARGWKEIRLEGRLSGEWADPDGYWGRPGEFPLPRPLDSLDDALALVPEGWCSDAVDQYRDGTWLWPLVGPDELEALRVFGQAPTHCAALCITILRAGESND